MSTSTTPATIVPRHHGFTCPNCGSHYFSTYNWLKGTNIGHCNAHQYTGNGCTFKWDRNDPAAEAAAMYTQTEEEWKAAWKEIKAF